MNYTRYIEIFNNKLAAIKSSPEYKSGTEVMKFYPPAYPEDIDEMEDEFKKEKGMENFYIYKPIRDFYLSSIGCDFGWQYLGYNDKKNIISGAAHIKIIYDVFEPKENKPSSSIYHEYRVFDDVDNTCCVCFKFIPQKHDPDLFYMDKITRKYYLMNLEIDEYLELLLETIGLTFWRELFVISDEIHPDKNTYSLFLGNLHIINPNAGISKYKNAYYKKYQ
jgi:hypothetical protein